MIEARKLMYAHRHLDRVAPQEHIRFLIEIDRALRRLSQSGQEIPSSMRNVLSVNPRLMVSQHRRLESGCRKIFSLTR